MATADTVESLLKVGRDMLPKNIIKASAESSYLGIMVAACASQHTFVALPVTSCAPGAAACRCSAAQVLPDTLLIVVLQLRAI